MAIFVFLLSLFVLTLYLKISFDRWLQKGREEILLFQNKDHPKISITDFPPLLQKYLKRVILEESDSTVISFEQEGFFRMKPEESFSFLKAFQIVSIITPMFSWEAAIKMGKLPVKVCDRLIQNKGELQARLWGVIPMAKITGSDVLKGELLRYLAELPWFPEAILNQPNIHWKELEDFKLEATLSLEGVEVSVFYQLSQDYLIESIFAPSRGRSVGKEIIETPWSGEFSDYQQMGNLLLPSRGEVSWLLDNQKFTYFKGKIKNYKIERGSFK